MNQDILSEFNETNSELLQIVSSFKKELFNVAPFEDSWTPGQVAEHILKSHTSLLKSLTGPVSATTRKADEYVQDIRDTFLDFTIRMESPRIIVPEKKIYDIEQSVSSLTDAGEQIRSVIEKEDLSTTCLFVEVKELGAPTRLELVNFVIVHTKRHFHQLKKIRQRLIG